MSQLVRLKKGKINFEVTTNPGSVLKYRKGEASFSEVLQTDQIFINYSQGEKVSEDQLNTAFATTNPEECAKIIVDTGDLQLSAEERKAKVTKNKNAIVSYVHKYFIDPSTKTPHPVSRIENAMDELKFRVDGDKKLDDQIAEFVKKLPNVLIIKKSEIEGTLKIPHAHLGAALGIVHQYATVNRENYDAEACIMDISLVPGDYDSLMGGLQNTTKGDFQFDIIGQENQQPAEPGTPKGKKGKAKAKGKGKGAGAKAKGAGRK